MQMQYKQEMAGVEFRRWLRRAKRGERVAYYRGYLAKDRVETYFLNGRFVSTVKLTLHDLADNVMRMVDSGHLHVTQQRNGDMDYTYYAERTGKPI